MTTIVLRQDYPAGLSIEQIDANFENLNNDKVEKTDDIYIGTTAIKPNRTSEPLDVTGLTISKSGVRADSAADGKFLKLVEGVSEWADDSIQASTDDSTTDAYYYPVFINSITGTKTVSSSSAKLYYNPSLGQLSATHFNSLSDASLKINVTSISDATEIVTSLRGVEYDWKDNNTKSSGVIAQELEKILPHLVNENLGIKSVNYHGIIGYLIEAVKELDQRIKTLEDK